ncbi:MAG: ABC transporter substrate-binding protein [Deltaproteobacteria bacterium]|nr:ABC transporter substrate-binding protein [Deltaproteobacteria bacterium]
MRTLARFASALLVALALLSGASAATGSAKASIEGPVESVLSILRDPKYAKGAPALREEQFKKIREIIGGLFDYEEICARAAGKNWAGFTPAQKTAFTDAFTELLSNTYIRKIQSNFHSEKVVFLSEEALPNGRASVRTRVVREGGDVPVDYNLNVKGGNWRIYDIHVEGVSLIQNYRSQFSQILLKESPDQLIERIRKRNKEEPKQ